MLHHNYLFFSFPVVEYYILNQLYALESIIYFTIGYLIGYLLFIVVAVFEERNLIKIILLRYFRILTSSVILSHKVNIICLSLDKYINKRFIHKD